jgi:hypothetical protein
LARIHLYTHTCTQEDKDDDTDNDLEILDEDNGDDDTGCEEEEKGNEPHCNVNYVANTTYTLIDMNDAKEKPWATCSFTDPSPVIPPHLKPSKPGDYVRMRGKDPTLKVNCKTIFEPAQALALDKDWLPFPGDMPAQDLFDLAMGDLEFHLWWQCIQAPRVKKVPVKAATKTKGKKRK